jgi:hypothetical protein
MSDEIGGIERPSSRANKVTDLGMKLLTTLKTLKLALHFRFEMMDLLWNLLIYLSIDCVILLYSDLYYFYI